MKVLKNVSKSQRQTMNNEKKFRFSTLNTTLNLEKTIRTQSMTSVLQRRKLDRETRIQELFLESHITNGRFEYVPNREKLRDLEKLCEENQIVLVYGSKSCGKSGLLCNWVNHRRHRNKITGRKDELVFYHNAGCSRASAEVAELLRRVCESSEQRFENLKIQKDDGVSEKKVVRMFHRFMEMMSENVSIVIVVDSANYLKSNDSERGAAYWLPEKLPKNLRIVISVSRDTMRGHCCGRRVSFCPQKVCLSLFKS